MHKNPCNCILGQCRGTVDPKEICCEQYRAIANMRVASPGNTSQSQVFGVGFKPNSDAGEPEQIHFY